MMRIIYLFLVLAIILPGGTLGFLFDEMSSEDGRTIYSSKISNVDGSTYQLARPAKF